MSTTAEDSKMSVRLLPIILSMINSTSSTSFSTLMIQKYRHPLSPLNERKRGPTPSNHTRYYLIRHNRGNHQTTSATNQRTLFRFSPYISILSVLMNSSSTHIKTSVRGGTHTHTHTHRDTHTHTHRDSRTFLIYRRQETLQFIYSIKAKHLQRLHKSTDN